MGGRRVCGTLAELSAVVLLLACPGCALNDFEQYRAENPDWVLAFPAVGADLEETVASLYAPPNGPYQRTVSRLVILRRGSDGWTRVPVEDLRSGDFEASATDDYAVGVATACFAEYAFRSRQAQVSWYILPGNSLRIFDHYEYVRECIVVNLYRPATVSREATERSVRELVAAKLGSPPVDRIHVYRKALALVDVGRVQEAWALLEAGDAQVDPAMTQIPRSDLGPSWAARREDEARTRGLLVSALARASR